MLSHPKLDVIHKNIFFKAKLIKQVYLCKTSNFIYIIIGIKSQVKTQFGTLSHLKYGVIHKSSLKQSIEIRLTF